MNVRDVPIRHENSDPWRMEQRDREVSQRAERARYVPSCEELDPETVQQWVKRRRAQAALDADCQLYGHKVPVRLQDRPLVGPCLCQRCGMLLQDGKVVGEELP